MTYCFLAGWPTYRAEYAIVKNKRSCRAEVRYWQMKRSKRVMFDLKNIELDIPARCGFEPSLDHELAPPQSSCNLSSEQLAKS